MWQWIKEHRSIIITVLITGGLMIYLYACDVKTRSLITPDKQVNRAELQLELDQFIGLAQLRMLDLDKQEQLRTVILQNALVLVQGQAFNPFGLITAIAAIYGVTQGGCNITKVVKTARNKRKVNNGNT